MALIFLSLGWLVGLYLGQTAGADSTHSVGALSVESIGTWLGGLASLALLAALLGKADRRLWITALAVALGLLGAWRALSLLPDEDLLIAKPGPVLVRGTIATQPEPRDAAMLLVLDVDARRSQEGWEVVRSRLLVRTDRYDNWVYGDRVVAEGTLRRLDSSSGYWTEHLAKQGIHTTLEYPHLALYERPQDPDFWRLVNAVRSRLDSLCAQLLPEPQASLLAGILVGARASMPLEFRDALNITGTSHIVAVSGFNVTVVAGLVELAALRYMARQRALFLAILAVWLYSLLTGLPPSATRAATMCTLTLAAKLVGRGGDALSFLCLSGAIMAGLDPYILYDLGFQLSFLATAGLVLLEPVIRGWLTRLPGWLAASLSVTLAAQLATLPIMVGSFHTLSLVAPHCQPPHRSHASRIDGSRGSSRSTGERFDVYRPSIRTSSVALFYISGGGDLIRCSFTTRRGTNRWPWSSGGCHLLPSSFGARFLVAGRGPPVTRHGYLIHIQVASLGTRWGFSCSALPRCFGVFGPSGWEDSPLFFGCR